MQAEARKVKEAALPTSEAGLQKLNVAELKAHLSVRGLDQSGRKPDLIARLLLMVQTA